MLNDEIARLIKTEYELPEIENIISLLNKRGTFNFTTLNNGLFPAAIVSDSNEYTGYAAVWVRDNIYVAHCHYILCSQRCYPAFMDASVLCV